MVKLKMDKKGCGIGLCILIATVFVISFYGYRAGQAIIKLQAVERGYAEWVSDKHGYTKFVWKENQTSQASSE